MKKNLFTLGLAALLTVNAFADEVSTVEEKETIGNIIEQTTGEKSEWNHSVRSYLEVENFNEAFDGDTAAFWGVGVNASKGKWSYDLNVEKRGGGNIPTQAEGWEATRTDYKVRYQLFDNAGFHVKYRSENTAGTRNNMRDRWEVGSDWANVLGTSGWFVVGMDADTNSREETGRGWYWEGDFGPSFAINDKLTITPTFYTTYEDYTEDNAGWNIQDHQLRLMASYKVTDTFTLMPRIRYSVLRDRPVTDNWEGHGRTRFELMGNNIINPQTSAFWGVAYDIAPQESEGVKGEDAEMFWAYFQLTHAF